MIWPSFTVTNVNGLYVVESGVCTLVETDRAPYYGVTWSEDEVYVGSSGTCARLLVFDRQLRRIRSMPLKARYPHQILWDRIRLFVTMPEENGFGIVNLRRGSVKRVFHTGGRILPGDKYGGIGEDHPNSIWVDVPAKEIYLCEHRQSSRFGRPSRIRVLDSDFRIVRQIEVGRAAHNVYKEKNCIYVCDSLGQAFVEVDLSTGDVRRSVHLGSFSRGLARVAGGFLIGLSDMAPRDARGSGDSRVAFVSDAFEVVDVLDLGVLGGVHGIRLLNAPDPSHNGIVLKAPA